MEKVASTNKFILIILISFSILSYFFGFFINENSAGGGQIDLNLTWKNLRMFESNTIFEALKLTASTDGNLFQSSRIPGVYMFHKLFNPFTENIAEFRLSVFFFSILIPIALYFALKIKFKNIDKIYLLLIASLVFLSPYFRTSAFWGNEENFGILSLIVSYIFLQLYLKEKQKTKGFIYLNLLIFFTSSCIYFDQKLAFIPAISFLMIFFSNKKTFDKFYMILIYFLYSLPVLYLFNLWGGILPPGDADIRGIGQGVIYPQHFAYSLSIMGFYFFPFLFLTGKTINKKLIFNLFNKKDYIIYTLLIFYVLYFLLFYEISNEILLGKGVFYKILVLITESPLFQKICLSIIFSFSAILIVYFIKRDYTNIFLVLFMSLGSIIYWPILQEYFDPLVLILILTFLNLKFYINSKRLYFLYSYFLLFLIGCNIYYAIFYKELILNFL